MVYVTKIKMKAITIKKNDLQMEYLVRMGFTQLFSIIRPNLVPESALFESIVFMISRW